MDNASGNVPNVPQPNNGEHFVDNAGQALSSGQIDMNHVPQPQPVQQPAEGTAAPAPIAGMVETMLPQAQPEPIPQPVEAEATGTLENDVRLLAPTPVDIDPPPLADVKPLSSPVATQAPAEEPSGPVEMPAPVEPPITDAAAAVMSSPAQVSGQVAGEPAQPPVEPDPQNNAVVRVQATQQPPAEPEFELPEPVVDLPEPVMDLPEEIPPMSLEPQAPIVDAPPIPEPVLAQEPVVEPDPVMPEPEIEQPAEPMGHEGTIEMPASNLETEATRKVMVMPAIDGSDDLAPIQGVPEAEGDGLSLSLDSILNREATIEPEPEGETLSLESESIDQLEPDSIGGDVQDAPLLDLPNDDELVEADPGESEPPLTLAQEGDEIEALDETPEGLAPIEEPTEEEPEKEKTVFQQETLKPDSRITQSVLTTGDPKGESYVKNEFFVSEGAEDPWILPAAATAGLGANQKKRRKLLGKVDVGIWSTFTTIFFFGAILAIGGLAIAWMMRDTIGDKIEARLAKKVEEAGYYASYDGWKYDPVRGLVLEGVTVFENANKVVPYAKVDNIGLNTDILTLFKTRDPLSLKKTISFRESNLILFNEGSEVANFKDLKGSLELDQNTIGLDGLTGQLEGALFEVEGDVRLRVDSSAISLWDSEYSTSSVATSGAFRQWYQAATETVVGSAQLGQSDSIIIRDAEALVEEVKDGAGRILKDVGDALPGDIVDTGAPSEPYKPMFAPRTDIVIPKAAPEPAPAPAPVPKPEPVPAPELVIEDKSEIVEIVTEEIPDVPMIPDSETSSAPSQIDIPSSEIVSSEPVVPSLDQDLLSSTTATTLPSLAFMADLTQYLKIRSEGGLPLITSNVDVDLTDQNKPKVKAHGRVTGESITMEQTIMQGITFRNVDAPYTYDHESGELNLPGFTVSHGPAGNLAGSAKVNLSGGYLDLAGVQSNLDLINLITEFDPAMKEVFQSLSFVDSPKIFIKSGRVPFENPMNSQLDFSYDQWGGMIVNTAGKKLSINEIRGDFKLSEGLLATRGLNAKVLDGALNAVGNLSINDPAFPFNGNLKVRSLPMESIAKYAGIDSEFMKGILNLDYQGVATKELSRLGGNGFIELQNSQLYKVPVIGPIQKLLGSAIPVFGNNSESAVAGNFLIESGVLMTSDMQVRSDGTKVAVKGQADLARQLTAFSAKASLDGALGVATGLATEQIEVIGRGPLHSPQIRLKGGSLPVGFATDGIKKMLNISDGSAEAMKAMMEEIAGGSGGIGGLINGVGGVGGVRVPSSSNGSGSAAPVSNPIQRTTQGATNILNGIQNGNASSVTRGIQGLIRGNQ